MLQRSSKKSVASNEDLPISIPATAETENVPTLKRHVSWSDTKSVNSEIVPAIEATKLSPDVYYKNDQYSPSFQQPISKDQNVLFR